MGIVFKMNRQGMITSFTTRLVVCGYKYIRMISTERRLVPGQHFSYGISKTCLAALELGGECRER